MANKKLEANLIIDGTIQHRDGGSAGEVFTTDGGRKVLAGSSLQKNISFGESYIDNYRDAVLDDGATFFPSDAGYEVGKLKESGVMNNCSLLLLPSAIKAGKLYSVKPQDRTGDFTVDRNSTATYIDEDGLMKTALANVPRIDYGTGEAALLVEPQSTNLIPYSEDFSQTLWIKSNILIESGYLAPDGTNTAYKVTVNSTGFCALYSTLNITGITISTSFYVKSDIIGKSFSIRVGDNSIQYTSTTEWSRFGNTFLADNNVTGFIANDIVGTVFYIWGAQFEQASTTTSYIPTNGTTVTRLADNITVPTPAGVTSITETIDGVEQTPITTIPATYSLPVGNINKVKML